MELHNSRNRNNLLRSPRGFRLLGDQFRLDSRARSLSRRQHHLILQRAGVRDLHVMPNERVPDPLNSVRRPGNFPAANNQRRCTMKFAKSFLTGTGALVLAGLVLSLLAPKAAHAIAATMVLVENTATSPVPNLDTERNARVPYESAGSEFCEGTCSGGSTRASRISPGSPECFARGLQSSVGVCRTNHRLPDRREWPGQCAPSPCCSSGSWRWRADHQSGCYRVL